MNRNWALALVLLVVTFAAYQPVWRPGWHWGDAKSLESVARLHSWGGLGHVWVRQGESTMAQRGEQYYPLTFTTIWLEYHLSGSNPLGYHLVNVMLHAFDAILLWLILRRLNVAGAWLAAAIWALHPVCVESVAWIAERRNTLSCLFFLGSILAALEFWLPEVAYLPPDQERRSRSERPIRFYWLSLTLYILALLSKTSTVPLPAVILLLVWWKRGSIIWHDVRPLSLFVMAGVAMGIITMHIERHLGELEPWIMALSLGQRFLIAGRAVWFYLGKLLWPHPLIFIYPLWKIDTSSVWAWLQPLAVVALLLILWLKRKGWGRHALVALLYFLALLAPVLGFLNVANFRRSFVSDHFQYLACMGPLALAAAGIVAAQGRLGKFRRMLEPILCATLLAVLGLLTWNQCRTYSSEETLWRTTIALNPNAWVAHWNMGYIALQNGKVDAAIDELQKAVQIHRDVGDCSDLGDAFIAKGRPDEAMAAFREALEIQPDNAMAYVGLGRACEIKGQMGAAIQNFEMAVKVQPGVPVPWYNLGIAYAQINKLDLAIANWEKAVSLEPDFAPAQNNLANALLMKGRVAEAEQHWGAALKADPGLEAAQANLAWVLATCPDMRLRNGARAVRLALRASQLTGGNDPVVLRTLAAAYAEDGRCELAVLQAQNALELAVLQGNGPLAAEIRNQITSYKNGKPFRDQALSNGSPE